jgi:hypothetical protein
MKTEEQQQHKIKREAKKTRKKSRREKERERERRKGELLKEPFREAPSGLIEYFIGMG